MSDCIEHSPEYYFETHLRVEETISFVLDERDKRRSAENYTSMINLLHEACIKGGERIGNKFGLGLNRNRPYTQLKLVFINLDGRVYQMSLIIRKCDLYVVAFSSGNSGKFYHEIPEYIENVLQPLKFHEGKPGTSTRLGKSFERYRYRLEKGLSIAYLNRAYTFCAGDIKKAITYFNDDLLMVNGNHSKAQEHLEKLMFTISEGTRVVTISDFVSSAILATDWYRDIPVSNFNREIVNSWGDSSDVLWNWGDRGNNQKIEALKKLELFENVQEIWNKLRVLKRRTHR